MPLVPEVYLWLHFGSQNFVFGTLVRKIYNWCIISPSTFFYHNFNSFKACSAGDATRKSFMESAFVILLCYFISVFYASKLLKIEKKII